MEIWDSSIVYLIDWTIQIKLLDFLFSETTRRECNTLIQWFMFESEFMNISSISIWDITQLLVEMFISVSTTTIDWSCVMKENFSCLDWLVGMKNSLKYMIDCILEDNLTEIQSCYKIVIRKDFKRINSSGLVNIMSEITEYGMMIRIVWICITLYSSSIEYYYYEYTLF